MVARAGSAARTCLEQESDIGRAMLTIVESSGFELTSLFSLQRMRGVGFVVGFGPIRSIRYGATRSCRPRGELAWCSGLQRPRAETGRRRAHVLASVSSSTSRESQTIDACSTCFGSAPRRRVRRWHRTVYRSSTDFSGSARHGAAVSKSLRRGVRSRWRLFSPACSRPTSDENNRRI